MRNRLWLLVTLHNNPELRSERRKGPHQESDLLAGLFTAMASTCARKLVGLEWQAGRAERLTV